MIVNVIGGSGFIGTRLTQRLNRNDQCDPIIFDKVLSTAFPDLSKLGDVRSLSDLREAISFGSIIINLAAEHRDDVSPIDLYYKVNVEGAQNICIVANEKCVKTIIFVSSVAVYGFAPLEADEACIVNPFNDYGLSKWEAEKVYRDWQSQDPLGRTLVIIRPTVVFGEQNRGNVYNFLKHIAAGSFMMIGRGLNRKSIAYVENVAAFLEYSISFRPGIHVCNYVDKPDFTMNQLVSHVNMLLGRSHVINLRLPYFLGILIGKCFDLVATLMGVKFAISAIRIKKFCANSVYQSAIDTYGFIPPISLLDAIEKTVRYEFIDQNDNPHVFYSE